MQDDKQQQGGQDDPRIDISDGHALRNWAVKLNTTPEQLLDAVAEVGDLAADVEMHLKGTHATTNADQEARADGADPAV